MEVTYRKDGEYLLPNLLVRQQPEVTLGKYAHMREEFIKAHRRGLYLDLKTTSTLKQHLADVEQQAREQVNTLVKQMAEKEGVNEELKATDQMKWVGLMNNFKSCAEEIVLKDLIYV